MVEISGFLVGAEIGRGGFGIVYRARDLTFERDVAIKVLQSAPGADLETRFLTECRAVGSLGGRPGLPTVYSTGRTADGAPYMAMELLPGGSLADRLPLPPAAVVTIGERLATALQTAHDGGVIHRDVKPANVLFDAADQPVLVDFGISALVGEATNSAAGNIAVSVAFAPPEVLSGGRAGVAADVYALGATLFCALTGRAPFVSTYGYESLATIAARIATARVEDLRPLGVPDSLARAIEIAMAKDPAARYPSAAALGAALASPQTMDAASPGVATAAVPTGSSVAAAGVAAPGGGVAAAGVRRLRRTPRRGAVLAGSLAAALVIGGAVALAMSSGSDAGRPVAGTGAPGGAGSSGSTSGRGDIGRVGSGSGGSSSDGAASDRAEPRQSLGVPAGGSNNAPAPAGAAGTHAATSIVLPAGASGTTPAGARTGARTGGAPRSSGGATPTSGSSTPRVRNHAPSLSVAGGTWGERVAIRLPITVRDADGDPVTLRVSGLPSWLALRGQQVTGTAPATAARVTTTRTQIRARSFRLTITATDSRHASTRTSATIRIRDTYRSMPDFIGTTGAGSSSISAISVVTRSCAFQKRGDNTRIYWQGVKPGSLIRWGQRITYRYGRNRSSCAHVSGHWPGQ